MASICFVTAFASATTGLEWHGRFRNLILRPARSLSARITCRSDAGVFGGWASEDRTLFFLSLPAVPSAFPEEQGRSSSRTAAEYQCIVQASVLLTLGSILEADQRPWADGRVANTHRRGFVRFAATRILAEVVGPQGVRPVVFRTTAPALHVSDVSRTKGLTKDM